MTAYQSPPNNPAVSGPPAQPGSSQLADKLQQLLAFASLIVIYAVFSALNPDIFLTWNNVTDILTATVVIATLALGTTFVIITGGIDLSIGTGMALCGVMAGVFITNAGLPVPVGVVLTLAFGALIGFVNGFNITILKIPPFIATLAMMMVAQGLALVISGSAPIYFNDTPSYQQISRGDFLGLDFPNGAFVLLLATAICAVLLGMTVLGRYTFSIGSNEDATALSGINVRKWKIIIYTLAGAFTGLAGIMISARLGSAQPSTGMGYELQAIAAVVIGGTSLAGGKGSISGTFIGALIIAVLNQGLRVRAISQEWQYVILGVVILLAVYIDMLRKKEA